MILHVFSLYFETFSLLYLVVHEVPERILGLPEAFWGESESKIRGVMSFRVAQLAQCFLLI